MKIIALIVGQWSLKSYHRENFKKELDGCPHTVCFSEKEILLQQGYNLSNYRGILQKLGQQNTLDHTKKLIGISMFVYLIVDSHHY